jgi:hypothetical protein
MCGSALTDPRRRIARDRRVGRVELAASMMASITALRFASAPPASSAQLMFVLPQQGWLDRLQTMTAGSTDDTDGTDGMFSTRAHPDHSRPGAAFTRERHLDAQRPEKRLRPPQ